VARSGKGLHLTREQCVEQIALLERQKRGIDVAIIELHQSTRHYTKRCSKTPTPADSFRLRWTVSPQRQIG
jgi:hypothetical protein